MAHLHGVDAKTVNLEEDAYERLCAAMLPGESFSEVIRRVVPEPRASFTGADLLEYIRRGGSGMSEEVLDGIEAALNDKRLPADKP